MQKVALLGGTQFIGYHLAWALHKQDYEVTLYNRGLTVPPGSFPQNVKHIKGNREHPNDFKRLFYSDYDFVIDLSGYTPAHVEPIITSYRDCIGHYLFCSTSSVYKIPPPGLLNEGSERTFTPKTYGGNKALAEDLLLEQYLKNEWPVTIFRPQGVWGAYQAPQAQYVFSRMLNCVPILMSTYSNIRVNLLYVKDFVNAFLLAMNNSVSHGSVYGVAGDDITSQLQFIDSCGRVCSRKPELKYITHSHYSNLIMGMSWSEWDLVTDNRKIKKELGLSFTKIENAIRETLQLMQGSPNYYSYKPFRAEPYLLMNRPIPKSVEVYWKLKDFAKWAIMLLVLIPNKVKKYLKTFNLLQQLKENG